MPIPRDPSCILPFPFATLNDIQLAAEINYRTNEKLPFSTYENITFDYPNFVDSDGLLSDLDPDIHNPVRTDVIDSKYYDVESMKQNICNNNVNSLFLFQNIRTVNENFTMFYECLAKQILPHANIFGMCETHLTDATECLYNIPGFDLFCNNYRSDMGGVAIYAKSELCASIVDDLCISSYETETIFIEITLNNKKELFGVVYRRPNSDVDLFISKLEILLNKVHNTSCNIAGDFNLDLLKYDTNRYVQDYVEMMFCKGFFPCINRPTRISTKSATLIDHLWCNNTNRLRLNGVLI